MAELIIKKGGDWKIVSAENIHYITPNRIPRANPPKDGDAKPGV